MNATELQNNIIRSVLKTTDNNFLSFLNTLLNNTNKGDTIYKLSDFEKQIVNESLEEYKTGKTIDNSEVFKSTEKWLKE